MPCAVGSCDCYAGQRELCCCCILRSEICLGKDEDESLKMSLMRWMRRVSGRSSGLSLCRSSLLFLLCLLFLRLDAGGHWNMSLWLQKCSSLQYLYLQPLQQSSSSTTNRANGFLAEDGSSRMKGRSLSVPRLMLSPYFFLYASIRSLQRRAVRRRAL